MKCERCGAGSHLMVNTPDGYICKTCAEHIGNCDECDMTGVCSAETLPDQERLESCHLVYFWR
jgi:hypothetical protein